jgi:peroxiredoxin
MTRIKTGDRLPDLELAGPGGEEVLLSSYRGRRVVLLLLRGLW